VTDAVDPPVVDLVAQTSRSGFRLARLEVLNWGTFGGAVWGLDTGGENTLLTGDIGSGKSTLVDAITTLLVPPQKLAYNKAAGADARERSLRSYVLGYYKSERAESGGSARAVPLRDKDTYSVVLARFTNEGFHQVVTLAQVFWLKGLEGQPDRFYVVADESLTIAEHFASFGHDINQLRKRLRKAGHEVEESFPRYGAAFRRRFGIDNEQALELFHQTVSMKSVGNLTDFVRQHMLQPFPVEPRITARIDHFNDLNRAHDAVMKAKAQVESLVPLVAECERHAALVGEVDALRSCRDALRPWFARRKGTLLDHRLESLSAEHARLEERLASLSEKRGRCQAERDDIKRAIAANGGDRIENIKAELKRLQTEVAERQKRAERYDDLARAVGLPAATDAETFASNRTASAAAHEKVESDRAVAQNALLDAKTDLRTLRNQHEEIAGELTSLRQRRSNIPARMLAMRESLCTALGVDDDALPFAGELLQVQPSEAAWEGAVERLMHGFGLSLLVPDAHYANVAQLVDRTHFGERLVYYRVRPQRATERSSLHPDSLVNKIDVRPESQFWSWLDAELARRFDYACCDTLDQFRRETRAITKSGQTKSGGERHEKDDRHRIDDRSRYVLGWTNDAKIAALEKQARDLETRIQSAGDRFAALQTEESALVDRIGHLRQLQAFDSFREFSWRPLAAEIDGLESERRKLESESDVLATLGSKLKEVEAALTEVDSALTEANEAVGSVREKHDRATTQKGECDAVLAATADAARAAIERIDAIALEALGAHTFTIESCDNREKDVRDHVQARIDAEDHKITRLVERIVQAMQAYRNAHPLDTREADASIAAASEYVGMLDRLRGDDLPRFERRFKELLNENTIREVASFQSQLSRERQDIKERIETINKSLVDIDYNPGRFIVLEPDPTTDAEIREFQQDLRACTEGTLTGSDDDAYSEAKFLQVRRIIERLRGREGTGEVDARWTRKVTDVRHWFTFSASERWREGGLEHEHYADSGGKSGGQKEKLAYTVLAASLAYQFGLEWGAARSRSFRFVVIDEAFGRGSDESTRYGLALFERLNLQLLIVTPLQKIHVIEPHVASVGFVHNDDGKKSMVRNLTIEEYRAERAARSA
jgi:uncharacterized protein YPO0396